MFCDICETIFSGGGELSPGGHDDEYFHHRSARSLKAAIAGGCQLCAMLGEVLPEHMLTDDWEYQTLAQEGRSLQTLSSKFDQPPKAASDAIASTYRSRTFYSPGWYIGRHGQNGGLKLDHAIRTTAFSLVYFRSDTLTGLPTIEFIAVTSAGRTGIGGGFPLRILLFDQNNIPSPQTGIVNSKSTLDDYRYHSTSTSDKSAWSAARLWLTDCAENHGNSCSLSDPKFLPSRLVYIDNPSSSEHDRVVKLCITAELKRKDIRYMTLSHRWGNSSKILQLTNDNIDDLTLGIPLSQLPLTFSDALEFASFCDTPYVWIDALCIKQDDRQDWSMEAPLMGSIYHNSFCNLSAAGSGNPQSSLFAPRTPSQGAPIIVSLEPDLWNDEGEEIINKDSLYACVPQEFFKRIIELAPVNGRAWVMQERLLSPRKIFFSEHQLFWECRKKQACEMFPNRIPEDPHKIAPRMMGLSYGNHEKFLLSVVDAVVTQQQMGTSGSLSSQADRTRLLRAWRELLMQYISCGITLASDRLIAINGITKYFEQALGDECVFGLWRSQLPVQLVFLYQNRTGPSKQQPTEGNQEVPSWSWAYHERRLQQAPEIVDPEGDRYAWAEGWTKDALITVLDITFKEELPLSTKADGTQITTQYPACLHLLCHLFPCRPAEDEDNDGDVDEDAQSNGRAEAEVFMGGIAVKAPIRFDSEVPDNVSIMPVFWYKEKMGWALVVSRVGGKDSRVFRRTGFMEVTAGFWNLFARYRAVCGDDQDTICLV